MAKAPNPYRIRASSTRVSFKRRAPDAPMPSLDDLEQWLRNTPMVCHYSGEVLTLATATIDHKIPLERSGTNDLGNLCLCTRAMNDAKGTMTDVEFKQLLDLTDTWERNIAAKLITRLRMAGKSFAFTRKKKK